MKKLIIALACLPLTVFAQKKFDNTIIFPPVSLNAIKSVLFQNNYTLEGSDTIMLRTTSKESTKSHIATKFIILRTDTATFFNGLYKTTGPYPQDDFEKIELRGMDFSLARKAWDEMVRIAKLLSSDVIYAKQN